MMFTISHKMTFVIVHYTYKLNMGKTININSTYKKMLFQSMQHLHTT